MKRNHNLAKAIGDASWGLFFNKLQLECDALGTKLVKIDQFAPSSKSCSCCGNKQDMPLAIRTYKCNNCGLELDRDLNAAINICNWSKIKYTAGTAEIYACGDMSLSRDSAQEASSLLGVR
jgi:putative transposase